MPRVETPKSVGLLIDRQGFTLNETLVSMALMGLAILGLSGNTSGTIRGIHVSENITVATHLAQDRMEEIKAQKAVDNGSGCAASLGPMGQPGGIYERCWIIQDSPLGAGLKQVDVSVSWRDYHSHNVAMTTLVYVGAPP